MNDMNTLAILCNALANPRRVEVFEYILARPETGRTFGEISAQTGIPASSLTHHLKEMVAGGVLIRNPKGATTIFTLNLQHLSLVLSDLMSRCCAAEELSKETT